VLDDEAKVLDEARHFFKGSEWATDAFRLKTAAIRAVRCEAEIFSNGPEQKFYLRQIKAMDYTLLAPADRDKFQFRDSNRVRVGEAPRGTALPPQELVAHDAALLALYGHMLYVGGSPATALGYYFRAYVVAPDDAVLNLCLGLAYVALAFKRQAANRQFHLQQGVSFFHRYAALRRAAGTVAQVQEMELNTGLLWNSVGLPHLAVPAYQRCIELSPRLRKPAKAKRGKGRRKKKEEEVAPDRAEEDFAPEAALALRMILAVNGDLESALDLTRKWLVL
jgi:general transcription factor 3C polypeptide 3 (transcription factor C subunit 4)